MKITAFLTILLFFAATAPADAQSEGFAKLGGARFDVGSERGKVVVLAVGARWLPFSKGQAATLNKLAARFDSSAVSLFFVMTDGAESPDSRLEEFALLSKLNVPILRDPKGVQVDKLFKPEQMPAYLVIGKDGKRAGAPVTGFDIKADMEPVLAELIELALR